MVIIIINLFIVDNKNTIKKIFLSTNVAFNKKDKNNLKTESDFHDTERTLKAQKTPTSRN